MAFSVSDLRVPAPVPACYDLGGTGATLTDANVVAGRLSPSRELGGRVKISAPLAHEALKRHVADPLGFSMDGALYGTFGVLTSDLTRAVRVVSVARGHDPRTFTLVAFGGAGPMHAAQLAAEMSIGTVLVPDAPGVLCALGLLMADVRAEFSQSHILSVGEDGRRHMAAAGRTVERVFASLERRASRWLGSEGIDRAAASSTRIIEMRYAGQGHQIPIAAEGCGPGPDTLKRLVEDFHNEYQGDYGYARRGTPVELVHFRVQVRAPGPQPRLRSSPPGDGNYRRAFVEVRNVYLGAEYGTSRCPVYWRQQLAPEDRFVGPAIVEQMDSTTVVLPGQEAYVDQYRSLVISVRRGGP